MLGKGGRHLSPVLLLTGWLGVFTCKAATKKEAGDSEGIIGGGGETGQKL